MQQIILASQSTARFELFNSLGIPFVSKPSRIDEKAIRDNDLKVRAEKLARAKAEKIASMHKAIVVACDTFSESSGRILEKPANADEARDMLAFLSGKSAVNYTGFCYIDRLNNIDTSSVVSVNYTFRTLYKKEIDEYVKKFPVTRWAAGFALVFPYITSFISRVEGSYTGLAYGLPCELLIPLLKKSGFEPSPRM